MVPDPTYGRYLLQPTSAEKALADNKDLDVQYRRRRVFLNPDGCTGVGEDVELRTEELDGIQGRAWVYYEVWTSPKGQGGPAHGCDIIMLHGMEGYGGQYAPHVSSLLEHGFRVIVPDLPAHGRSTGIHVLVDRPYQLADGVRAVARDLLTWGPSPKKRMMMGASLGGYTASTYCLPSRHDPTIAIDALWLECPFLGVTAESNLSPLVQTLGKWISQTPAGCLVIKQSVGLVATNNPRAEEEWKNDPRKYQGGLRVATAVNLLEGLKMLDQEIPMFDTPVRIVHGDHDRVTDHHKSIAFIDAIASKDKSIKIVAGGEHALCVVGLNAEEDALRQEVLGDRNTFLLARVE